MRKWIAISGSWRTTNERVEYDVRQTVDKILSLGDGIVTGGALGVDYIATDQVLLKAKAPFPLLVILPTPLLTYERHFFRAAQNNAITEDQAIALVTQLRTIHEVSPESLIEMNATACTEESYYARNSVVLEKAHELRAFQVNGSQGVQDTIDKARARHMPVQVFSYTIKPGLAIR